MNAIILNRTLKYKGRDVEITPIPRYLAKDGAHHKEEVDEYGFRSESHWVNQSFLAVRALLRKVPKDEQGGIIVGEGDVGKTWLTEQLAAEDGTPEIVADKNSPKMCVKVLRLCGYESGKELREDADKWWQALEENDVLSAHLVLDGLDEKKDLEPSIERICAEAKNDSRRKVWVTGRSCHETNRLIRKTGLKTYCLLPFSKKDIHELAKQVGANGDEFFKALTRNKVAVYASKPGGAVLLLRMFGDGKLENKTRIEITEDIAKSFAREGRDGEPCPSNETEFEDEQLVDAAAWIAAHVFFAHKDSLWMGEKADCPSTSLPLDCIPHVKEIYGKLLLDAVTKRRLFEPLDEYRLRIAYDTQLVPFLVAYWIKRHAARGNELTYADVEKVLKIGEEVGDSTVEVLKYLCLYHPEFGKDWIPLRPAAFLECMEAIKHFGFKKYYDLLEKKLVAGDEYYVCSPIMQDTKHFRGQTAFAKISLERLNDKKCTGRQAELAATILQFAEEWETSAEALVKFLEKNWLQLTVQSRSYLSSTLRRIVGDRDWKEVHRLKCLLDTLQINCRCDEDAKGFLLGLLWPKFLTTTELISYLIPPVDESRLNSYHFFLDGEISDCWTTVLNQENVIPLLEWAERNPWREDCMPACCRLSSDIVTFAWQWAEDPEIARLLVRYIWKCSTVDGFCCLTVSFWSEDHAVGVPCIGSSEDFKNDKEKRYSILSAILENDDFVGLPTDSPLSFSTRHPYVDDYQLFYPEDFPHVYRLWERKYEADKNGGQTRLLMKLLDVLSRKMPLDRCLAERARLFTAYPDRKNFSVEWLRQNELAYENYTAKLKADRERWNREDEKNIRKHMEWIHDRLREKITDHGYFQLADAVIADPGTYLKLRAASQSPGNAMSNIKKGQNWDKLNDDDQMLMRKFAKAMVAYHRFDGSSLDLVETMNFQNGVVLLWEDDKDFVQSLPAERWSEIVHCLLWTPFRDEERDTNEILDWACLKHRAECEEGAYAAICEGLKRDHVSDIPLKNWGRRITDAMFHKLLTTFRDDEDRTTKILLMANEIKKSREGEVAFPAIENYAAALTKDFPKTLRERGRSFGEVLALYPKTYFPKLVALLEDQEEVVREWVQKGLGAQTGCGMKDALRDCDVELAAICYFRLIKWYPEESRPVHENGAYWETVKDRVYEMISNLRRRLLDEPSDAALKIVKRESEHDKSGEFAKMYRDMAERLMKSRKSELSTPDALDRMVGSQYDVQGRLKVVLDGVTKNGAKAMRKAVENKGGRPPKAGKSAKRLTQKQVGTIFDESEDVVSAWERGLTPPPMMDNEGLVYNKELRGKGDIASLQKIAEDYKKGKRTGKYIDSKHKERLIENSRKVNNKAVSDAIVGMRRGDTPLGDDC